MTSHRILTSEEVIREKMNKAAEKEKIQKEKEMRKQLRQLKKEAKGVKVSK